ncbi:hypothetical protein TNCV_197081 [Trichonephila clavipes]|nr:hypothetical protein TNCV_197081 [Trichonephila clavipes]
MSVNVLFKHEASSSASLSSMPTSFYKSVVPRSNSVGSRHVERLTTGRLRKHSVRFYSSVRSCIIIHQNELIANNNGIRADIWIKDLIPISLTSQSSSLEHMQVSVATSSDPFPNHYSTTLVTVPFNTVGLIISSAPFPPDEKTS